MTHCLLSTIKTPRTSLALSSYYGSKRYQLKYIYPMLDTSKNVFVDVFGGSGNVILNLPDGIYGTKIYNDKYEDMFYIAFYIKYFPDLFISSTYLPPSEQLLKSLQYALRYHREELNSLSKAVFRFYCNNVAIDGLSIQLSVAFGRSRHLTMPSFYTRIPLLHEKLINIAIMNRDFRSLFNRLRNQLHKCMFFCDPPYIGFNSYYKTGMTLDDHKELAGILNQDTMGSVMLTYYPHPKLPEFYPPDKWQYYSIMQRNWGVHTKPATKQSLIITNYTPPTVPDGIKKLDNIDFK